MAAVCDGTVVSTVSAKAGDAVPRLPAASATTAVKLCELPLASAEVVKLHVVPVTVAVPMKVAPS